MASDDLVMWLGAFFIEWFFLCKRESIAMQNLGWFAVILTSIVGVWFNVSAGNPMPLLVGGIMMLIGILNFTRNLADD